MNCPNCSTPTDRHGLEGKYGPLIEVDLCFPCHVLWLDKRESVQLAPRGTLDLFRLLHEHGDDPRHALASGLRCPRCERRLSLLHDIGKGGRFSYYSCPFGDGRLTPFSEFLKEKEFVRGLSPAEKDRLSAEVKQVQCSGCGAPVDLVAGFECGHCGSPLTVLDAEAVEKTLRDLQQADRARSGDPAEKLARAHALASMEAQRTQRDERWWERSVSVRAGRGALGLDLLTASIEALFDP